jgi:hypothetical protein
MEIERRGKDRFDFITPEKCKRSISYEGILSSAEGNRMVWAPRKISRSELI